MLTQEDLGKISDDELNRRFRTVKNWIVSKKFSSTKTKNFEIELCYLYREHEIRENRRAAHRVWLTTRKNYTQRRHK